MKKLALLVFLILTTLTIGLLVRTGLRYRIVYPLLSEPEVRQRMSIIPTNKTFCFPTGEVQKIDLGYASFDIGVTGTSSKVSIMRNCIWISNSAPLHITFMAPFSSEEIQTQTTDILSATQTDLQTSVDWLKNYALDQIEGDTYAENTQIASLWSLTWMTKDQFLLYTICLELKAGCRLGINGVLYFKNPYSKGLIRTGESPTNPYETFFMLSSLDGRCRVGGNIQTTKASAQDISTVIDYLARSFRFSIETIPSSDEIARLIKNADIKQMDLDKFRD